MLDDYALANQWDEDIDKLHSDASVGDDQTLYIEKLRQKLQISVKKCSVYKRRCAQQDERLSKTFNEDQLNFLKTGSHRGVKWSEETLAKALKLYLACGEKGYEELKHQNLPYPCIRTIQHRIRNLKLEAGILEDR